MVCAYANDPLEWKIESDVSLTHWANQKRMEVVEIVNAERDQTAHYWECKDGGLLLMNI
jgi:hypothetical protein